MRKPNRMRYLVWNFKVLPKNFFLPQISQITLIHFCEICGAVINQFAEICSLHQVSFNEYP